MYCDSCGAKLDEGQKFCRACGKPASTEAALRTATASARVAQHLRVLAALWIVRAILLVIPGLFLLWFHNYALPPEVPPDVQTFVRPLLGAISWVFVLCGAACIAAAYGLLERLPWARLFTIILGAISLVEVPLGTALGIYTLWVLLPESSDVEYRQLAAQL